MSHRSSRSGLGCPSQAGCQGCRKRRVKCDGGRPSCSNCVRRGYECNGYATWDVHIDPGRIHEAPCNERETLELPTWHPSTDYASEMTLFAPIPSLRLQVDDPTRSAFDYFRFKAYESYEQRGYPILWADCALSIALSEPAVFCALAASGAAEQAVTHSVHATLVRPADRIRSDLAIDLYSRAIRHLQTPMQKAIAGGGSLMPVILSCLVFVIYETTFGTHLNALRHARTGFNILNERLHRALLPSSMPTTNGDPAKVLSQGHLTTAPSNGIAQPINSSPSPEDLQMRLESLTEACHNILATLRSLAQQSTSETTTSASSAAQLCCVTQTISRIIPLDADLQNHMASALKGLRTLSQQLRLLLVSTESLSLHLDLLFMQIRGFHASFSLAMSRGLNEQLTDYFTDEIVRTLGNAERLIRLSFVGCKDTSHNEQKTTGPIADQFMQKLFAAEHTHSSHATMTIGPVPPSTNRYVAGIFEFGILPALYLIACKSRTSSHRRRAARLLCEANRVEAINSSHALAAYADAVIEMEERAVADLTGQQAAGSGFYADEVPKLARFLDVVATAEEVALGDGASKTIVLTCTRLVDEGRSNFELLEYRYDCETKQHSTSHLGAFAR